MRSGVGINIWIGKGKEGMFAFDVSIQVMFGVTRCVIEYFL